ncbi:MAG: hypothetical protein LBC61_01635 [Candidatus Peribacteria bacterium]|jgi:hypothetical protein|nr:hypothetical protein [Candidatus Peribacteria bacterium]
MRYDWIEADKEILNNGTLVSEKGMPKFLFKSGDITDEEKFVIKNINNLI